MKYSRKEIQCTKHELALITFESQQLTSFSGLVIFQKLFLRLQLKRHLRRCFNHCKGHSIYGDHMIVMQLIVHILLGYRELRDSRYYCCDPMVQRLLGLNYLPDTSTISRTLNQIDDASIDHLCRFLRRSVLKRVHDLALSRLTLDFDGSVISTGRFAEGSAVGFNKKKKGARSYYPLFCTIAQTGQILDVLYRPGNVHDSNGAQPFILSCIEQVKAIIPNIKIEVRMDSAFFSDKIISLIDVMNIEFTMSVPFERLTELKKMIERRQRWNRLDEIISYFEILWKPKKWEEKYRFIFIREYTKKKRKGLIQLDIFVPYEYGYEFKVIATNKQLSVNKALVYHNGRGSQEGVFAELKSQSQMDYIPVRRRNGNQAYLLSAIIAHNLTRELQMIAKPQHRNTTQKRAALWKFQQLKTLRRNLLQRTGRITKPKNKLTLTMSGNNVIQNEIETYLHALDK